MLQFILAFFLLFTPQGPQTDDKQLLTEIREKMPTAFQDEKACNSLLKKYKNIIQPETILKGYIGGLHIALSKHAALMDKMSALKTGTSMLEEAITEKPDNIELRFLRLTIQLNLPGFLGYSDHVESDKKFVLKHYDTAPPILKNRIIDFVKTSGHFNETEQAKVTE